MRAASGSSSELAPATTAAANTLSPADFDFLRRLIRDKAGISFSDEKYALVVGRLQRRVRATGVPNLAAYCKLLRRDDGTELPNFINALTTNFTSFFREPHHFEFLRKEVVPAFRATSSWQTLRIWSSASSTGEEVYSALITLAECGISPDQCHIVATDIDTTVLERASRGVFSVDAAAKMSPALKKKYFLKGTGRFAGQVRVRDALARQVHFQSINLTAPNWPDLGTFDLIFCRNVLIYFDQPTKQGLVRRFAKNLRPDGWLMLGHSETIEGVEDVYDVVGNRTYQRRRGHR